MGEMRQSSTERAELERKWQATPQVQAMRRALARFVHRENLQFDAEGLTRTAAFCNQWIDENGPLPESGILIG